MKSLRFAYFALLLTFINMSYQFPNISAIDYQSNQKIEPNKKTDKKNLKRFIKPFLIISGGTVLTLIGYKLYKNHNSKPIIPPQNLLPKTENKNFIISLDDRMQSINPSLFRSTEIVENKIVTTVKDEIQYHNAVISYLKEFLFDRDVTITEDTQNYPNEVILDDGKFTSKFRVPTPIYQEVKTILDKEQQEIDNVYHLIKEAEKLGYNPSSVDIVVIYKFPAAYMKRINNDSIKHNAVIDREGKKYGLVKIEESTSNKTSLDSKAEIYSLILIIPEEELPNIQNSSVSTNTPVVPNVDDNVTVVIEKSKQESKQEPIPTTPEQIKSMVLENKLYKTVYTVEEVIKCIDSKIQTGTDAYKQKETEKIEQYLREDTKPQEIECPYNNEFCAFKSSSINGDSVLIIGPKKSRVEEIKNELKSAKEKKEFNDRLLAHAQKNCNSSNNSCMSLVTDQDNIDNIYSSARQQNRYRTDDGIGYTIFTCTNTENNFQNHFVVLDQNLPMF